MTVILIVIEIGFAFVFVFAFEPVFVLVYECVFALLVELLEPPVLVLACVSLYRPGTPYRAITVRTRYRRETRYVRSQ